MGDMSAPELSDDLLMVVSLMDLLRLESGVEVLSLRLGSMLDLSGLNPGNPDCLITENPLSEYLASRLCRFKGILRRIVVRLIAEGTDLGVSL